MKITVSKCGRFNRLSLHDGILPFYPFPAGGLMFALTECFELPTESRGGISNLNTATLNFAMFLADWQSHWFRLVLEIALVMVATIFIWHVIRSRQRVVKERLRGRKRATGFLVRERKLRLTALRESRSLSQRLLTVHEDERRRLARELHDDVTQRLARLAIDAAQAERGVPSTPNANSWRRMHEELVRLSGDVHSLAYRLHPSILDELGLAEALRAECDRVSRCESISVKIESRDVPEEIPAEVALCLFRIGQESLRNVARHARASAAEVSLIGMDGGLQLVVHDDGIGFNSTQPRQHASLGLASMEERIRLANGQLDVKSEPGHGTTIAAWVPLKEALK